MSFGRRVHFPEDLGDDRVYACFAGTIAMDPESMGSQLGSAHALAAIGTGDQSRGMWIRRLAGWPAVCIMDSSHVSFHALDQHSTLGARGVLWHQANLRCRSALNSRSRPTGALGLLLRSSRRVGLVWPSNSESWRGRSRRCSSLADLIDITPAAASKTGLVGTPALTRS